MLIYIQFSYLHFVLKFVQMKTYLWALPIVWLPSIRSCDCHYASSLHPGIGFSLFPGIMWVHSIPESDLHLKWVMIFSESFSTFVHVRMAVDGRGHILTILLMVVVVVPLLDGSYQWSSLNLPEEHIPYFFRNNPDIKQKCEQDSYCPHKVGCKIKISIWLPYYDVLCCQSNTVKTRK